MSTESTLHPAAKTTTGPDPDEPAHHPWRDLLHHRHRESDLVRGARSPLEVLGQSVAAAGPSIAIAGTLPFIYPTAGVGTLGSVVLGTVIVLLVAVVVAQFARQKATTGSLYSYAAEGLGPWAGFVSGWGLALGYTGIASACAVGSALFGAEFLKGVGVAGATSTPALLGLTVVAVLLAVYVTARGVVTSTRVSVVLEVLSLLAIVAVLVATLVKYGVAIDVTAASAVASFDPSKIAVGAVIAVTIFVGFESAGSLGVEAKNPYRAIPRAVIGTAVGAGALYLVAGHTQTVAFSHGVALDAATTPFNAIADATAPWLSPVVGLGVAISSFACTVASIQGAARALFNLSREGALPTALGHAHRTWKTPHVAIGVLGVVSLAVPVAYVVFGPSDTAAALWASYLATMVGGTYGYLLTYVLVAVSALVHFGRAGRLHPGVAIAAVLATVGITFVGWNVFTSYDHTLLYAFTAALATGVAWYAYVWVTRREHARRVGTFTLAATTAPAPEPQ